MVFQTLWAAPSIYSSTHVKTLQPSPSPFAQRPSQLVQNSPLRNATRPRATARVRVSSARNASCIPDVPPALLAPPPRSRAPPRANPRPSRVVACPLQPLLCSTCPDMPPPRPAQLADWPIVADEGARALVHSFAPRRSRLSQQAPGDALLALASRAGIAPRPRFIAAAR